jgi:hypothetical protein
MCQRQPCSVTGLLVSRTPPSANDTLGLGVEIGGAQIQVEPVLPALYLRHPLQENIGALAVGGNQALIGPARRAIAGVAEHAGPELR